MTRAPLVLIPGLASDGWIWSQQAAALADVADVSIGDTLHDDSIAGMAARILAAAPPRFALGAISMGGYVAFEIMRRAPERVDRLAVFDSNPRPDTPEQVAQRRGAIQLIRDGADYAGLTRSGEAWLFHPDTPEPVRLATAAMAVRVGADAYVRQLEAVIARVDSRPTLPTIRVPTIVVVGEHDRMTPPKLSREIAAGIPGAALHIVPRAAHLPPIEQPDATTHLLRDWLAA